MSNLTAFERRNRIIEIINEAGKVTVSELSTLFGVSAVAIRTDLAELEKQGALTRVHGGAVTGYKAYYDMSLVQRANTNAEEKKAIAESIKEIIRDNDTILMNAGTTMIFVMRAIADKKVTIVTNSIALAVEGAKNSNFKIILLGGAVDSDYQFTYGTTAINELCQYEADFFIMSVDGIHPQKGISTFYHQEVELCKCMTEHANKTIVASDFSKVGRVAFAKIGEVDLMDVLVTSYNAETKVLNALKKAGVDVRVTSE